MSGAEGAGPPALAGHHRPLPRPLLGDVAFTRASVAMSLAPSLVLCGLLVALAVPVARGQASLLDALSLAAIQSAVAVAALALAALPAVAFAVVASELASDRAAALLLRTNRVLSLVPGAIYGLAAASLLRWQGAPALVVDQPRTAAVITALLALVALPTLSGAFVDELSAVAPAVRHSAVALGASPLAVIWFVVLPSCAPRLSLAALSTLVRLVGEGVAVALVVAPGGPLLSSSLVASIASRDGAVSPDQALAVLAVSCAAIGASLSLRRLDGASR